MQDFHPLTTAWFTRRFAGATEPQLEAWPEILTGRDVLISAPTGSGKTLAAFLICLDRLIWRAAGDDSLEDRTEVVYVFPLKALSNDIKKISTDRWPRNKGSRCPPSAPGCGPATRPHGSVRRWRVDHLTCW